MGILSTIDAIDPIYDPLSSPLFKMLSSFFQLNNILNILLFTALELSIMIFVVGIEYKNGTSTKLLCFLVGCVLILGIAAVSSTASQSVSKQKVVKVNNNYYFVLKDQTLSKRSMPSHIKTTTGSSYLKVVHVHSIGISKNHSSQTLYLNQHDLNKIK